MIFFYQYFLSVQVPVWPSPGYTLEIQGVAKKKFTTKDVNFTGFRVDLGQNVKKLVMKWSQMELKMSFSSFRGGQLLSNSTLYPVKCLFFGHPVYTLQLSPGYLSFNAKTYQIYIKGVLILFSWESCHILETYIFLKITNSICFLQRPFSFFAESFFCLATERPTVPKDVKLNRQSFDIDQ